jgi:hypothetical protein
LRPRLTTGLPLSQRTRMRLQAHHTPPSGRVHHSNGLSLRLLRRCLRITNFVELRKSEVQLRRISIPRTPVNSGAGAWRPRRFLLFEEQLLVCQSASAAHTALTSARLSASKTTGLPIVGVCCALMDTVTERLPSALAAAN